MNLNDTSSSLQRKALIGLLVLVTVAFVVVLTPFYTAVMWGAIIGLLFAPLNAWLLKRWKRPNLAALATLALVVVLVILPLLTMAAQLVQEGTRAVEHLRSGDIDVRVYLQHIFDALPAPLVDLLRRFGLGDVDAIQARVGEGLGRASQFFATQVLQFGQDTMSAVIGFFVTLYLAYFLLRDGRQLLRLVRTALPLSGADKAELGTKFATVVRATVKGNVVVAAVQGALGGLAFWALGVYGPLLWGTVMAFLSLLPAVGAGLVWLPVALYLLATGAVWKGVALIVYGVLVIGLVDNVLRPLLVGKDTKLPDWLVLISTLGGMAIFGINGFVIGPVIAAMFIAVWAIFTERRGDEADG